RASPWRKARGLNSPGRRLYQLLWRCLVYPIELVAMKTQMDGITRRRFLGCAALAAAAGTASAAGRVSKLRFGFTTYQWGSDWDIPALITNCAKAKAFG